MRPELGHKESNSCSEHVGAGASWHRCDAGREGELIFRSENPRDSYTSAASLYQNLWNRHVPTRRRIQNWLQLKKMPVERLEDVVTVLHCKLH